MQGIVRGTHRLIDLVLHVDPRRVLNLAPHEGLAIDEVLPDFRRFLAAGKVDYASLRASTEFRRFSEAVAALRHATPPSAPDGARAWWINLYNGLIIHAVIEFGIRRSVWEDRGFFRRAAYLVGGFRMSADDIEHGVLRGNRHHPLLPVPQFGPGDPRLRWSLPLDPRIHFALVCAANSCPAINLYTAQGVDRQLEMATTAFINGGGVEVEATAVMLSSIFKWYQTDFGDRMGVLEFIARYVHDEASREVLRKGRIQVRYSGYDWKLNHWVPERAS